MPKNLLTLRAAILATACAATVAIAGCTSTVDGSAANTDDAPAIASTPATVTVTRSVTRSVTAPAVTTTVTADPTDEETSSDSAGTPPTGLVVGKSVVTASDNEGAGTAEVVNVKRATKGSGEFSESPHNGTYVFIDIRYTCTSGTFDYNPYDWTIRDPDGRSYDFAFLSGYDGPELDSGTLAKGSKARGTIVFDAPKGPLTLEYAPGFGAPAIWDIPA